MSLDPNKLARVTLTKNPNYKKSGEKSYAYALNKYGIKPTVKGPIYMANKTEVLQSDSQSILKKLQNKIGFEGGKQDKVLAKTNEDGQAGLLTAEDIQWDALYLAEVEIGTPKVGTQKQVLKLDFDTGSSDLWCWSSRLSQSVQNKGLEKNHVIFNTNDSETWKDLPGESFEISYGDGSHVEGNVGIDTINVGGLTIKNQAIETAVTMSKQFQTGEGDGLMGLAFEKINTVEPHQQKTPVDNMIDDDIIPDDRRLFTCYLGSWRDKNDPDHGKSYYTFGFIDQDEVDATGQEMHYVDINNSNGFWQFPSTKATVNGEEISLSGNTAIADTGTTLAMVSDKVCKAVYSAIPGAVESARVGGWVFPTDTSIKERPVVQFAVGDKLFNVEKEDLAFVDLGNSYAYGGIQSRGNLDFDILGDTFLKALYAVFDQGNQRFGCVQRVDPTQSADLPSVESQT